MNVKAYAEFDMQSKTMSFIEAATNIAIGFIVNFALNMIILPIYGFNIAPSSALHIGLIITVFAIARSYFVRRLFDAIK